jgi:2-oxoglutarate ferredoxin oxidoreductase subunit delta
MPRKSLKAFTVNPRYCKSCEICVALCPKKILSMKGKNPVISDISECTLCATCEVHCPDLAIELEASEVE